MPTLTPTTLGQFCRELAIQLSPLPTLLTEWGLTPEQFTILQNSAGYKHEITVITNEMLELGPDAGYVYRMKALSEIFIKDVVQIMQDPETPRSTKVELIKFCAEMARVKEKVVPAGQQVLNRGPSVVFNFGAGLPIQSMEVVGDLVAQEEMQGMLEPVPTTVVEIRKGFSIVQND